MAKTLNQSEIDLLITVQKHLDATGDRKDLSAALLTLINRLTETKPRAKAGRKVISILMDIDQAICNKQGSPHGRSADRDAQRQAYTNYMTEASAAIREQLAAHDITSRVRDTLEYENYHDILLAADIAFGSMTVAQVVDMFPYV